MSFWTVANCVKAYLVTKSLRAFEICSSLATKGGVWLMAVLATVAAPCLPIFIELLKTGEIKADSFFITTTVMAAAFAVSAEHILARALYMASFVVNLILDVVRGPFSVSIDAWAGTLLLSVAFLHIAERAYWHLALDRPFPDYIRSRADT